MASSKGLQGSASLPAIREAMPTGRSSMGRRRSSVSLTRANSTSIIRSSESSVMAETAPLPHISPFAHVGPARLVPSIPPALPMVWGGDRHHPIFRPPAFESYSTPKRLEEMKEWMEDSMGVAAEIIMDVANASNWLPPEIPYQVKLSSSFLAKQEREWEATEAARTAVEAAAKAEALKEDDDKLTKKKKKSLKRASSNAKIKDSASGAADAGKLTEETLPDSPSNASWAASTAVTAPESPASPAVDGKTSWTTLPPVPSKESWAASTDAESQPASPSHPSKDSWAGSWTDTWTQADSWAASSALSFQDGEMPEAETDMPREPTHAKVRAATKMQCLVRMFQARRRVAEKRKETKEEQAEIVIASAYRGRLTRTGRSRLVPKTDVAAAQQKLAKERAKAKRRRSPPGRIFSKDSDVEAARKLRARAFEQEMWLQSEVEQLPSLKMPCIDSRLEDIDSRMQNLDLRHCCVGRYGAKMLMPVISELRSLESIELMGNYLGSQGIKYLAWVLKKQPNLKLVGLAWNGIGDEGCEYLASIIKLHPLLTEISLTHNRIADAGAQTLADAINGHPSLQHIDLRDNCVHEEGARCLLSACSKRLSVNLANNLVAEKQLQVLVEASPIYKEPEIDMTPVATKRKAAPKKKRR